MDVNMASIPDYDVIKIPLYAWAEQEFRSVAAIMNLLELAALPEFDEPEPTSAEAAEQYLREAWRLDQETAVMLLIPLAQQDQCTELRNALELGADAATTAEAILGLPYEARLTFQNELISQCEDRLAEIANDPGVRATIAAYAAGLEEAEVAAEPTARDYYDHYAGNQPQYDALNRAYLNDLAQGSRTSYWQWGTIVLVGHDNGTKWLRKHIGEIAQRTVRGELTREEKQLGLTAHAGYLRMVARGRGLDPGRITVQDSVPPLSVFDRELTNALKRITKKKIQTEGLKEMND
ncbi:hypothetical protein OG439_08175 [Amycolatopsis sp. NBC_01307]|uniref:hypothetical protein n=1 Tax=Amycolatopsis sp. NBC_01307 TaxID=2903561 RepID=UPI002E0FC3BC|nr:hypothetical protein OG439_08175 [Amycolatopsis sp. NBC_01307]